MKAVILLVLLTTQTFVDSDKLESIQSVQIDKSDYRYNDNLESYMNCEELTIWSMPFENISCSSVLHAQGTSNYDVANLSDHNLQTAWIEGDAEYGIGTKIEVTFNYDAHSFFGSAYQFYGVINVFNGYCKSLKSWQENSRVKTFKVYFNDTAICFVDLVDTWHFQYFDISKFFRNAYLDKNKEAPYEINEGDRLIFEVTAVYEGSKYKDVGISEFMIEGAKN